jgi:hypothetical protein
VVDFSGPCKGRTYGPLMKSPAEDLTQDTPQEQSSATFEDSSWHISCVMVCQGVLAPAWHHVFAEVSQKGSRERLPSRAGPFPLPSSF